MLAFKSADIDNVLCWFGETSIPPNLVAFLGKLGVKHVVNYPDRDQTGGKAAEKIAAALHGSGIQFHAAALPDYLGDKSDINTLWQYVKFDREAFLDALAHDTQVLDIQPKPPQARSKKKVTTSKRDADHLAYYAAIEEVLGIQTYKGDGWSKQPVACPIQIHEHDDTRPSAYWHRNKHILRCFKCGETYLAKQVGRALGLEWKDFHEVPDQLTRPTLDVSVTDRYHFPQGIPDSLRQTLLSLHRRTAIKDQTPALMVLELRQRAIQEQHLRPQSSLTVSFLKMYGDQIGWHPSAGVIRRGLKQLAALGFLEVTQIPSEGKGRPTDHYHPKQLEEALIRLRQILRYRARERIFGDTTPDTITPDWFPDHTPEAARQFADRENRRRRRLYDDHEADRDAAEVRYQREVEKIDRRYTLARLLTDPSIPLPPDLPCRDSQGYRALYYQAQIIAAGETGRTITRAKAARQLGVSSKTLSVLRVKAGITADEQFETMPITTPEKVVDLVNEQFPWAANRDFGRFLDNGEGDKRSLSRHHPEALDRWVQQEMTQNRSVTVYIQTASRERLATKQEQQAKTEAYNQRRENQRKPYQSRPISKGGKPPSLLETLLTHINEEECPRAFSMDYTLRQIAMIRQEHEAVLLAFIDLFPHLHPLKEAYISRGGKYEKKPPQVSGQPEVVGKMANERAQLLRLTSSEDP